MEDTEWNDVLRAKGIIPEITEEQVVEIVDQVVESKTNPKGKNEFLSDDEDDYDDDRIMQMYRQKRLQEMKMAALKKIHGEIEQISKTDYTVKVTEASEKHPVVLILFQSFLPKCKLALESIKKLALLHPEVSFLSIIADQCIPNYPDRNCPTMIVYDKGEPIGHFVGMERMLTVEGIETTLFGIRAIDEPRYEKGNSNDEDDDSNSD